MSYHTIETTGDKVTLTGPYNTRLGPRAARIGGRWDPSGRRWVFDARDEARVRDLAREIYGTADDLVTVRVAADDLPGTKALTLDGRLVAERRYRDDPVRLGYGVIIVSGSFDTSAGSTKYPFVGSSDVVLEVRDVPRATAEGQGLTIVDDGADRRAVLTAERDRLVARLAQVDAEMERLA
ncbi:MAG: hypothetical protein FWH11_01340 [Micrococcales bacterium]|nr:hypothetical protein [Micrococcales bacterium]